LEINYNQLEDIKMNAGRNTTKPCGDQRNEKAKTGPEESGGIVRALK
jgi:hypothetical protein